MIVLGATATAAHAVNNIKNFDSCYNLLMRPLLPPVEHVGPAKERKFFLHFANISFIYVDLCVCFDFFFF